MGSHGFQWVHVIVHEKRDSCDAPCVQMADVPSLPCPTCGGVEAALAQARQHDVVPGSVKEVHLKHLLALNLRKLCDAEYTIAPRSYILLPEDPLGHFHLFVQDFKISQAFAVLRRVVELASSAGDNQPSGPRVSEIALEEIHAKPKRSPEGLWGRELVDIDWEPGSEPTQALTPAQVSAAIAVVRRAIYAERSGSCGLCSISISEDEWCLLQCFSWFSRWEQDAANVFDSESSSRVALELLREAPARYQVSLLRNNLWVLKPSNGQFGKGQLILDRLPAKPAQLLQWAADVGRGGLKGTADQKEGCVLQKLVESPHLLSRQLLLDCWPPGGSSFLPSSSASRGEEAEYAGTVSGKNHATFHGESCRYLWDDGVLRVMPKWPLSGWVGRRI